MEKINVTLRQKEISNGRLSLYLDFYPPILNPKTNEYSRREFLKIYLFKKPKDQIQKIQISKIYEQRNSFRHEDKMNLTKKIDNNIHSIPNFTIRILN